MVLTILFGVIATVATWWFLQGGRGLHEWHEVVTFMVASLSIIITLLLAALTYVAWVPKWERHERRTGHIPGGGVRRNGE